MGNAPRVKGLLPSPFPMAPTTGECGTIFPSNGWPAHDYVFANSGLERIFSNSNCFANFFLLLENNFLKIRQFPLRNLRKVEILFTYFGTFRKHAEILVNFHQNSWTLDNSYFELLGKTVTFWKPDCEIAKKFDEIWLKLWMLSGSKTCKSCRSRQ